MTSKQEPDYRSFVNKPISPYLDDDDKKKRDELIAYRAKKKQKKNSLGGCLVKTNQILIERRLNYD